MAEIIETDDLEKEGYYALKAYVQQQIEIIREFKLKEEITKNPKEDKYYERVKAIGEELKKMINDLSALRLDLKIKPSDEIKSRQRTSPESIAHVLGNTAGQQD